MAVGQERARARLFLYQMLILEAPSPFDRHRPLLAVDAAETDKQNDDYVKGDGVLKEDSNW